MAIGAAGAPTVNKALGITSVTRTGAGRYDVVLDDRYTRLMNVSIIELFATSEDITFQLTAESVAAVSKTVSFACKAAAVDTDPASGSRLLIKIDVKNSDSGE